MGHIQIQRQSYVTVMAWIEKEYMWAYNTENSQKLHIMSEKRRICSVHFFVKLLCDCLNTVPDIMGYPNIESSDFV